MSKPVRAVPTHPNDPRRDQIATAALQAIIMRSGASPAEAVRLAVQYADALSTELDKPAAASKAGA